MYASIPGSLEDCRKKYSSFNNNVHSKEDVRKLCKSAGKYFFSVIEADKSEFTESNLSMLEMRKNMVWAICATTNKNISTECIEGTSEEICLAALIRFLEQEIVENSSGWSRESLQRLLLEVQYCFDSLIEIMSSRSHVNDIDHNAARALCDEQIEKTKKILSQRDSVLLTGGWESKGESEDGHFILMMISRYKTDFQMKLFDTQSNLDGERVEPSLRKISIYSTQKVKKNLLESVLKNNFIIQFLCHESETAATKNYRDVYYSEVLKPLRFSKETMIIRENTSSCVPNAIRAFLIYWQMAELNRGEELFSRFQSYLWKRYEKDFEDSELHESLVKVMQKESLLCSLI